MVCRSENLWERICIHSRLFRVNIESLLFIIRNHWTLVILCYANHLYHYIKEGETHFGIDYSQNSKEKVETSTDEKPSFYVISKDNELNE